MPSLNKVILIGRLTRDPELRYTSSGLAVASFSLAVDRRFKDQQTGERKTDFFRCTAWRQKAEFMQQYVQKGRLVCVEGSIELNEYTDKDGQRRMSADVQCDNIETLDTARDGEGGSSQAPPQGAPQGGSQGGYQNRQGGQGASQGGEYFDDEMGAAPQGAPARSQNAAPAQQAQARPAAQSSPQGNSQGAPRPQGAAQAAPAGRGAAPQPAYPQNDYDFDDSDPFADE